MRVWFKKGYKLVVWKRFNKFYIQTKMFVRRLCRVLRVY